MIDVLQNWSEIGEATKFLIGKGLPTYPGAEKNYDLYHLYKIVESMPRRVKIVDLGCGGLMVLKFLYAMGFKNLYGIDLTITIGDRIRQLTRMLRERSPRIPYHLRRGDITKTKFPANIFDIAICVSTIEHGVDLEKFLSESGRILKPGGLLFVTTDYWSEKIHVNENEKPFGLPYKIFSEEDIKDFIKLAEKFGFSLCNGSTIPKVSNKCIAWRYKEYTFICVVFKKK
jgi:SAM-dependent methyltransferase